MRSFEFNFFARLCELIFKIDALLYSIQLYLCVHINDVSEMSADNVKQIERLMV